MSNYTERTLKRIIKAITSNRSAICFSVVAFMLLFISSWTGSVSVDELGPIYPVESFILEGNFDVDEYPSIRVNSFVFDGHWYSAFSPFFGFLTGPFRWLGDILGSTAVLILGVFHVPEQALTTLHNTLTHSIQIIPSLITVIAGSFITVRVLRLWEIDTRLQELARWTYIFGTTLRFYAISTFPHVIGSTLLLAAFYVVMCIIREVDSNSTEKKKSNRKPILVGLFLGSAVLIRDTYAIITVLFLFILIYHHKFKELGLVFVSAIPFALLFLGYNWLIFGNPLSTPHMLYGEYTGRTGWVISIDGFLGNFLAPRASIFIFTPILVLFLIGIIGAVNFTNKRYFAEIITLYAWIISLALIASLAKVWTGDYSWGPRYFTEAIPPLILLSWLALEWISTRFREIDDRFKITGKTLLFLSLSWGVFLNTVPAFISPWSFYSDLISSGKMNHYLFDEWSYNIWHFPHAVWNYNFLVALPEGRFSSASVQAFKMIAPKMGNIFGYILLFGSIFLICLISLNLLYNLSFGQQILKWFRKSAGDSEKKNAGETE
ncbi:MAG: hypothetical protein ACTSP4_12685 [Candidatus Hodarchaeales archaeon]